MADSPEHKFISEQFNIALNIISRSRLFGIKEAQRRTFDYACVLFRDFQIMDHLVSRNLMFASFSSQFSRDLLQEEATVNDTAFYSTYDWRKFVTLSLVPLKGKALNVKCP